MKNQTSCKRIVKSIFLLSLIILQFNSAKAQNRYGIVAGIGTTTLNKVPNSTEDRNRYSSTISYWGGVTANIPFGSSGLSLFTSAIYNKRGYDYLMQKQSGAATTLKDSSYTQRLNYIDVNLMLQKKFSITERSNFFIGTGPSLNMFMGGSEQISANYFGSSTPVEKKQSKLTVGNAPGAYKWLFLSLNSAVGFQFGKISVWANYNLPLDFYYLDPKKKLQHKISTFGINAGYTLFGANRPEREKKEKKEKEKPAMPTAKVDSLADGDADGVPDFQDKCPGHKGVAKYGGCPVPDSDGDGINDDEDKCPLVAGTAANNGCPKFTESEKRVIKDTMQFTVYFEPAKSEIRSEGFSTLSEVVKLLKANPKLRVIFNGHTDNAGSVEANSIRSFDRALICADYVTSFFIDRSRLTVAAYGNKQPVADLADPLLQWKNRRVEIFVFEAEE